MNDTRPPPETTNGIVAIFGLFRYLILMHREDLGEEPENVLLTDIPILATIAAWAATSALILGFT